MIQSMHMLHEPGLASGRETNGAVSSPRIATTELLLKLHVHSTVSVGQTRGPFLMEQSWAQKAICADIRYVTAQACPSIT
jgi:hypothetical protein